MVRQFAASTRALSGGRHSAGGFSGFYRLKQFILAHDGMFDRLVPTLVVVFLAIASFSIFVQSTTSRDEALEASDRNLEIATQIAASWINIRASINSDTETIIRNIPPNLHFHGRDFLIIDDTGKIAASSSRRNVGMQARRLFKSAADLERVAADSLAQRVILADNQEASIMARDLVAPYDKLVVVQSLDDGLYYWRKHASAIGAILLCFAAITVAFCSAYYAQRTRTRLVGRSADDLRAQFEVALEQGRCGLWQFRIGEAGILWSSSMFHLLGLPAREQPLSAAEIEARLHPEDTAPMVHLAELATKRKREFDHLFRLRHASEGFVWLRMRAVQIDDAQAPRVIGIVMDVTAERKLEEETHRSDLRLRDAIESISETFVLWDENNRLVLCNSKYQSFHHLPGDGALQSMRRGAVDAEAAKPTMTVDVERSANPDGHARIYEAQFEDGRWLQISEKPTRDGGYVSVGTDITNRKIQEAHLFENDRKLRQTIKDLAKSRETLARQAAELTELADLYLEQKAEAVAANRAKAQFLANMNHEIRTPLNHIIGFSEIIAQEVLGPVGSNRYREYAEDIRRSGFNLLCMISDVLDMARIEAGRVGLDRSLQSIGLVLENVAETVRDDAACKSIIVEIDPDWTALHGKRLVHIDQMAISQALANLMRNAIRLSPGGGRLSLRARLHQDATYIYIADTSSLLSAQELEAIRDPFGHIDGMLENGCKGSGLGVAIARSLIELHGGTLRMRALPMVGSLVMIRLPTRPEHRQLNLPMLGMAA